MGGGRKEAGGWRAAFVKLTPVHLHILHILYILHIRLCLPYPP